MDNKIVRQFNHTLLWPVQLQALRREANGSQLLYWDNLKRNPGPWRYVEDPLLINDESCLIGYEEFVYFLPYVQRFLYGVGDEGRGAQSSVYIFKRDDVHEIHVRLNQHDAPVMLDVMRLRLYFFYDIDIALIAIEVAGKDIALETAIELMDRLGRPYPPAWDSSVDGNAIQGAHCPFEVKFIDKNGAALATSDYANQNKFLDLVRGERQTPVASHWEYLLLPLIPAYRPGKAIKY